MAQLQPTTTITIDDQTFNVADLSTEVQQLTAYLDDWRQDEQDQASELLKTRAALRDIQNTLLQQIQEDLKDKEAVDGELITEEA